MRVIDYIQYLRAVAPELKFDRIILCDPLGLSERDESEKIKDDTLAISKLELDDDEHYIDGCYDVAESFMMYLYRLNSEIQSLGDKMYAIPDRKMIEACKTESQKDIENKKYIVLFTSLS
jgi:hypothetical protein